MLLREIILSDAQSIYHLNADPLIIRYTGDPPFDFITETKNFITAYPDYKTFGYDRWVVILKNTSEILGWCGLKNESGVIDLGYRFMRKHCGNGYATEAATASLYYGFNLFNMSEIIGTSAKENEASTKVLKKTGMHFYKNDECNGLGNAVYYKITKQDFIALLK